MYLFKDKIIKLEKLYKKCFQTSLTFLQGPMGLGKTYTVNKFLANKDNVLHINQLFGNDYFLTPFLDIVPVAKLKSDTPYLNESEIIKKEVIKILKEKRYILYFESINSYKLELFSLCLDLMRYALSELRETNTFIIAEIDSDLEFSKSENSVITNELFTLSFDAQFINYKKLNIDELKEIFMDGFRSNINISDVDWKYIADSSFGNISWLLLIVNYLKQEEYIYYSQDNHWECLHIPNNLLDNIVSKYIYSRYDRLDKNLQTILQKSSLLGPVFFAKHLKQSFELLQIEQELNQIERISDLIHNTAQHEKTDQYSFESAGTHRIIQKLIPSDKHHSWNNILAQYYEKKITDSNLQGVKRFQLSWKVANCYEHAHNFQTAIIYYLRAIRIAIDLLDYSQALTLIHRASELLCFIKENNEYLYPLLICEAKCYSSLGKYDSELGIYEQILEKCDLSEIDLFQILYNKACALYNTDQNEEALILLRQIEDKLPALKNDHFTLNVCREFAAIYYFCRLYEEAGEYFTRALHVCKKGDFERDYYLLLRQSSMFWDLEISQKAQLKAWDYFAEQKDIKEKARVSHNLGTDALWMGKDQFAVEYLDIAIKEFSKFGCSDIHYTYNSLGVYKAAYEQAYDEAIIFFEKMKDYNTDIFSKLISTINCASCYCAKKKFENCEELIKKYETMLSQLTDCIPPYLIYYYINKGILLVSKGHYNESEHYFIKCLKLKLKNEQLFLIGCYLKQIYQEDKDSLKYINITEINSLCSISHRPLYDKFYSSNVCLSTLRFWW